MQLLKSIDVDWNRSNFIHSHLVPETEQRFMVALNDSQLIHLVSVETGEKQILIQGSPNSFESSPSAFFLKCGDGYELHFCTVNQQKSNTTQCWYRWYLGPDFFMTLRKYRGLPLEFDVDKLMTKIRENDDLKTEKDKVTKERDELKAQVDNSTDQLTS